MSVLETSLLTPRHRFTDLNHLSLSLHLGSFRSEILGWGFFEPRWWRNYLHTHSCFEVCYAFHGAGIFRIANTEHTIQAGEVFVARPGDVHEIISSDDTPLGIYFWTYTLLPDALHKDVLEDNERTRAIDALLHAFIASRCVSSTRVPAMQRTLELLTEEVVQRAPGYTQVVEGLVTKLVLDTARSTLEEQTILAEMSPTRNAEEAVVQMIVRYLRDNYHRPLAIRELAAQVHLSERHTSRLFRKIMGVSIMDYLTTLRLEIAAQRLLDQHVSIKEIAQETGYPDVRYFITLFRKNRGVTPAVFRKQRGTRFISQYKHPSAQSYETK